jgi:uncharacterized UPF0160 family protein
MDRLMTHWGRFHADDVFAATVLQDLYPDARIVRTRERGVLEEGLACPRTAVFDVGACYQPSLHNYDHHQWVLRLRAEDVQTEPAEARRPNGCPYASFGLVWKHFGEAWVQRRLASLGARSQLAGEVVQQLDRTLVSQIDAADCGAVEGSQRVRLHPETSLVTLSLGVLIADLYRRHRADEDGVAFGEAITWSRQVLEGRLRWAIDVADALDAVHSQDAGDAVLVLDRGVEWQGLTLRHHRMVVYPETGRPGWLAQCVPVADDPLTALRPFPQSWAGLRDEALQQLSGVPDAEFCHGARFIAGASTREGAVALAVLALRAPDACGSELP